MIKLSDVVNCEKDKIFISAEKWAYFKDNYDKEDIKDVISRAIDEYKIPMPLRHIEKNNAISDFEELLALDTSNMINTGGDLYTRYDYEYGLSDIYINQVKTGNMASDYYQQYNRFLCDSVNAPSPFRSWFNPKFRNGVLNALFTLKFKEITMTSMRSAISLRKYIASQFKPSVAKFMYDFFDAKHVLDFSSGWGDRLAGFYAADGTQSYTGIDPNHRLFDKYAEQQALYSKYNKKDVNLIESPAEDIDFNTFGKKFDFIFTSPPYFNIERYNQEENQSWKRYRKFDDWLNKFLFVVLEKAWEQLEDGGIMAINISDVYSGHRINQICDPMNKFISSLPNASYMGAMGMKMSKRPNSKSDRIGGVFVEPVWLFSKNNKITLKEYIKNKKA
jgi:hypothetical protein